MHTREGQNVWHLAAASGDVEAIALVAAGVEAARARQDADGGVGRVLAAASAGFNAANRAVNLGIAAATAAALPSQLALPMGRDIDKDAQTRQGKTALLVAVEAGHAAAVGALLAAGVDARRGDNRGNTALHAAAWRGDAEAARLLLAHADAVEAPDLADGRRLVNAVNLAGLTPLHFAAWRGERSLVRLLVNAGACTTAGANADSMSDVTCNKGATPLHLAAMRGDLGVARLLLRAHARLVELTAEEAAAAAATGAAGGSAAAGHRALRDPRRIPDGYAKIPYMIAFDLGRPEAAAVLDPTVPLRRAIELAGAASAGDGGGTAAGSSGGSSAKHGKKGRRAKPGALEGAVASSASEGGKQKLPAVSARSAAGLPSSEPLPAAAAAGGAAASYGAAVVPSIAPPPKPRERPRAEAAAAASAAPPADKSATSTAGRGATSAQAVAGGSQPEEAAPVAASTTAAAAAAAAPVDSAAPPASAPQPAAAAAADEPPAELVCPITGELLRDPVRAGDGRCYERESIEMWLALGNRSFPGGRARVTTTRLEPCPEVKARCDAWRSRHEAPAGAAVTTEPAAGDV